nr:MAG TPA: hypothetical protein [Caudoviricetes sp.]
MILPYNGNINSNRSSFYDIIISNICSICNHEFDDHKKSPINRTNKKRPPVTRPPNGHLYKGSLARIFYHK